MIKANNQNPIKTRQKFDQTFKREAVNHWLASGKSASVVAVELGILPNRLYAWRQRFAPADAGGKAAAGAKPGSLADLQAQLPSLEALSATLNDDQKHILDHAALHAMMRRMHGMEARMHGMGDHMGPVMHRDGGPQGNMPPPPAQ